MVGTISGGIFNPFGSGSGSGGSTANAPATTDPTTASRSSVWFSGDNTLTDYYTVPETGLNYPNSDWAEIFCVKFNYAKVGITQHIINVGQFGTGTNTSVCLYLNGNTFNARIRAATSKTVTGVGAITPSLECDKGWYYFCIRRVGSNIEIAQCPKGGSATTIVSDGTVGVAAMTPNGVGGTLKIGTRSDVAAGTANNNHFTKNNMAYWARINGTFSNAQLESLAAGQDIMTDLGLSPLAYIKFNSLDSVITDSSGNGRNATKVNSPVLRGGPQFSTAPVTITKTFDQVYGWVHQRDQNATTKVITATGTYKGAPDDIKVRVISKTGTQVTVPVTATYPDTGSWSATLTIPQGSEYALEAYYSNDTTKIARTQMPWGVGAVLLMTGESIADQQATGNFTEAGFAPVFEQLAIMQQRDVWQISTSYTAGQYRTDPDTYGTYLVNTNHTSGTGTFAADRAANPSYWTLQDNSVNVIDPINSSVGLIMHTIERLRANLGIPVMAYFGAKTGSPMFSTTGGSDWSTYTATVTHGKLKAAIANMGGDAEFINFVQGANDGNSSRIASVSEYQSALQNLIPQIRSYLIRRSAGNPLAFIPILGGNTAGSSANDANWRKVRSAQMAAIPNISNCYDASSMHDLSHADGLHPDAAVTGYIRLGKRQAQAILNAASPSAFTNGTKGAEPVSAAVSGANTIDVLFNLNGATVLSGLTGPTGLTGFVVKDAGATPQAITATSITAATVRLTFAGSPVAGWTVDYVDTQNPTRTNLLYTNLSVIGDTVGPTARAWTAPLAVT